MSTKLQAKLAKLQDDYKSIAGQTFKHFYCPILFRDEETELCKAHIVNESLPNSARNWTVQRKDVDNFYGTYFESDFVAIQYNEHEIREDVFVDKTLAKTFSPRILLNENPIEYFFVQGAPPQNTPLIEFESGGKTVLVGLKISPADFNALEEKRWAIEVSKNLTVPAVVTLIKAAHLTLFELLGYRYVLSSAGRFVGHDILGNFFLQNQKKSKSEVLTNAREYFGEFVHMVRDVEFDGLDLQGTVTDKTLFLCWGYDGPCWAWIVYIKTAQALNAVMIPAFENPDAVNAFLGFLKNTNESLEVSSCRFDQDGSKDIDKNSHKLTWKKTGIFFRP